jgi:hypothetical protein
MDEHAAHDTDHDGPARSGELIVPGQAHVCFGDSLQLWTRTAYVKSFSAEKSQRNEHPLGPLGYSGLITCGRGDALCTALTRCACRV